MSSASRFVSVSSIKKAALMGGSGVRQMTHAYKIMIIAMLVLMAFKFVTVLVSHLKR